MTFNETFNEIKGKVEKTVTFSRADFDKLAKAYVNDVDMTTTTVAKVKGEKTEKEVKVQELFRGMLKTILKDFGVDEQEAARVMTKDYQIRNVDGMYELCSELIYHYVLTGRKFNMLTKENLECSFVLEAVAGKVDTSKKSLKTQEPITVTTQDHFKIKAKSKCPSWLKETIK